MQKIYSALVCFFKQTAYGDGGLALEIAQKMKFGELQRIGRITKQEKQDAQWLGKGKLPSKKVNVKEGVTV